ncbi:MAG: RsmG family class I SAM-dependent methyltransferase, partial [Bacteroidota bacterium]
MTRFVAELVSGEALEKLRAYEALMRRINRRFNLVSPASAEVFWERHIEHCLVLASRPFPAGASVVDWGTGGGLPAVPLAILFPAVQFTCVDSVGKKVHAVRMAAREL